MKAFKSILIEFGKFFLFILALNIVVGSMAWVWDESFIEAKAEAAFAISATVLYWLFRRI